MTKLEKHFELQKQILKEKDPTKKEELSKQLQQLIADDPDVALRAYVMSMADTLSKLEVLRVHEALDDVLPFISQSYISKTYFHRSRSWFSQRLNGNEVMGIICSFDAEEMATLKSGLIDMRDKLNNAIEKLNDTKGFDEDLRGISLQPNLEDSRALVEKLVGSAQ